MEETVGPADSADPVVTAVTSATAQEEPQVQEAMELTRVRLDNPDVVRLEGEEARSRSVRRVTS